MALGSKNAQNERHHFLKKLATPTLFSQKSDTIKVSLKKATLVLTKVSLRDTLAKKTDTFSAPEKSDT